MSGQVTYGKGKRLPSGAVTFVGADGQAINAEIEDGKYRVPRAPIGVCKVTVMTAPGGPTGGDAGPTADEVKKPRGDYVPIPERYAFPDKSGLTHTVTEGPTTFDIAIK